MALVLQLSSWYTSVVHQDGIAGITMSCEALFLRPAFFWRCMRCGSIYDVRCLGATCEWVWPRRPPRGAVKRSRCVWRQYGASGDCSGGMSVAGFVPWCPLQRIEVYRDSDESWLLGSLTGQQELSVICDRSGHRHYRDRDIATSCYGLQLSRRMLLPLPRTLLSLVPVVVLQGYCYEYL